MISSVPEFLRHRIQFETHLSSSWFIHKLFVDVPGFRFFISFSIMFLNYSSYFSSKTNLTLKQSILPSDGSKTTRQHFYAKIKIISYSWYNIFSLKHSKEEKGFVLPLTNISSVFSTVLWHSIMICWMNFSTLPSNKGKYTKMIILVITQPMT